MGNKIFYSTIIFVILLYSSCISKNQEEINKVLLCALDKLMSDNEYRDYLIRGENYIAWVRDGYIVPDSVVTEDGKVKWSSLEYINVNKSYLKVLNSRFPKGHELMLITQQENENIMKNKKNGRFSCWYFGGLKRYKNRYYLTGGFAVSSKAGIGATFIIESINGDFHVIDYAPAIL